MKGQSKMGEAQLLRKYVVVVRIRQCSSKLLTANLNTQYSAALQCRADADWTKASAIFRFISKGNTCNISSNSKRDTRQSKTWQKHAMLGSVLSLWQPSHATHDTHQLAFVFQGSFLCMYQTGWETHTWFCLPSPLQFAQSALTLRCPLIEYGEPWDWGETRTGRKRNEMTTGKCKKN